MSWKISRPLRMMLAGSILLIVACISNVQVVRAQTAAEQVCAGLGAAVGGDNSCVDPEGETTLGDTVASVINILSIVVGAVAVVMIVVGGLKYVSSQGDSSGIASAKNTIIYALVGIIIVALAQVIVRFVVARSTADPVPPADSPSRSNIIRT